MSTDKRIATPPSWINTALIEKALNNNEEKKVEVESCDVDVGTAPGDNYASIIYRAKVKLTDGSERTVLIKTVLEGEMEKLAELSGSFARESLMFDKIVPQIQVLLEKAAPGRWSHLIAKCLLHDTVPRSFILVDDLRPQGFRMADRKRGLGLRHCLLAIRALARYHAGGHVLLKNDPSLLSQLQNPLHLQEAPDSINIFVQGGIAAAAQVCRDWPGFEDISRRLDKFKGVVMEVFFKLYEVKPESFNVISHGDFWANNMLFRYNEDGIPIEIRLVDLQFSMIQSPAMDVLYFLSTSISDDVSIHHQDLLIREYYFELKEALSLLGTEAPSFETLLADIDAHGSHSLTGTITVHPIVKATTPPDMQSIMTGDLTSLTALYNSPEVKKYLQRVLPELARKGWLPAINN